MSAADVCSQSNIRQALTSALRMFTRQCGGRRCRSLSHGNMIPGVQSFGRPPDDSEKHLMTPDQLRAQLTCIRSSKAVVVLLVDLLDASGSFFSNVRQLVGANPIVIVGTKVGISPCRTACI